MEQPEGFKVPGSSNKVYCLLCALYGLKQATSAWNKELHKSLLKLNFKRSKSDPGVYIFQDKSGIMLFIVYVNDGLLMSNSAKLLNKKKTTFLNVWEARDVRLSEGRGQNNQQPTPNDNNKRVVVFLCGSGI